MGKKWLVFIISVGLFGCSQAPKSSANTLTDLLTPPPISTPSFKMPQIAEDLVTDAEVSATSPQGEDGGHSYYDRHYQRATWPGDGSGATWGIGVDGSEQSAEYTTTCWSPYYPSSTVVRLANCSGDTSPSAAKQDVADLQDIIFPWKIAINEFNTYEIPNYYAAVLRAFPGVDQLSVNAQGAIISVAYNRGLSFAGPSRVDMRTLRTAVANQDYQGMANAILHMSVTMRAAWENEGIYDGMVARRQAEAKLVLTPPS